MTHWECILTWAAAAEWKAVDLDEGEKTGWPEPTDILMGRSRSISKTQLLNQMAATALLKDVQREMRNQRGCQKCLMLAF